MSDFKLNTPVVFIIFNRTDTTERVFAEIARAKPSMLLVVADGPRKDVLGEAEKCAAARAVIERVDWDCEVLTNYSDVNLGCKIRVSSGLDWVFEKVEEAIILEDDCLPHPTFFRFCQELLERYRDDERIMKIAGSNFQFGRRRTEYSYYYSRYAIGWGWATWRRVWNLFDLDMKLWPEIRDGRWLFDVIGDLKAKSYENRIRSFELVFQNKVDTWDYQFGFSCFIQSGLIIVPNVNLISNIGFGEFASHTKNTNDKYADMKTDEMDFSLKHPPFMMRDSIADDFYQKDRFKKKALPIRALRKLHRMVKRFKNDKTSS